MATFRLKAVLPDHHLLLLDPVHLHFMLAKGLRSHSLYSCVLCVLSHINTLWRGDEDLRLYITTVQDG
jgi:hypothetical protein